MNKRTFPVIALLAVVLIWSGCSKGGKLDQPSRFTPPSGPVELKQKWTAGERAVQNLDMKMNMEFSVPNQPGPIKQEMNIGQEFGLTVLKKDASETELEMEFLNMHMKMAMGGKTLMDYDSSKKPDANSKNRALASTEKTFNNIVGSKILYFLDATNKVERIEGVDTLANKLSSGNQAAAAGFKSMFNEGYFKQIIGSSQHLPSKPVQPGDTWQEQSEVPSPSLGAMVMDYNFTFRSWEKHGQRMCARVEFDGTLKTTPDETNATPTGMKISIEDGNFSGVSWFDPELGTTLETDSDQDMKMIMTLPKTRARATPQTMTNLMHQTITLKLESVK